MPRILGLNYVDTPVGSIQPFGGSVAPTGWLICDGTSYLKTQFPQLATAIGGNFGSADGTHFNVPDLRGRFVRGSDNMGTGAAGRDPGDSRSPMATGGNGGTIVGSVQPDAFQGHYMTTAAIGGVAASMTPAAIDDGGSGSGFSNKRALAVSLGVNGVWGTDAPIIPAASDGVHGTPRLASESRGTNANANYIIKYF